MTLSTDDDWGRSEYAVTNALDFIRGHRWTGHTPYNSAYNSQLQRLRRGDEVFVRYPSKDRHAAVAIPVTYEIAPAYRGLSHGFLPQVLQGDPSAALGVLERLSDLFIRRGVPDPIRSDNGPEFTAERVREWFQKVEVNTLFIEPGSPWENGYIESFNGKLRDELLDGEIFDTLLEAKVLIERWRNNTTRSDHTVPWATELRYRKQNSSIRLHRYAHAGG
ncbi:Integrase core domain protein [Polystyrenella longa]|uniref:Integrase core domain protein n=1 Tax=Polystyrenella longa TaxID=2528007 RepID=A0A518CTH4_9PLAN|nr:Integrase core domain protein [Polystyrenella longa]